MKITVISEVKLRRLVAVVSVGGGLFIRNGNGSSKSMYINTYGAASELSLNSLEELVGDVRKNVYEGDSVTIQF